MRFVLSGIVLIVGVILSALAPAISVVHRWMIEEPKQRTSILLRKVKRISGAGAVFQQNRPSFRGGFGLVGSIALASLGFIAVLTLAAAVSLVLANPPTLQAASPEHVVVGFAGATFAEQLRDTDGKVKAKHDLIDSIFTASGAERDFNKPEVLKAAGASTSAEVVEKVQATNRELDDLVKERERIRVLARTEEEHERRKNTPVNAPPFPGGTRDSENEEKRRSTKSFGQVITESDAFTGYKKTGTPSKALVEDYGLAELKTLFETGAGWAPDSPRSNIVIDKAVRPIQVLDLIPTSPMSNAAVPYMEETTATNAAAERAEGGAYAESTFALTERSETARSIGTSVPVTDEQLEDVPAASGYLDRRLRFGVLQRADLQIVLGNGTPPNLQGIKTKSGVQANSGAGVTKTDAMLVAMKLTRTVGRAIPSAHIMDPTDWTSILLEKTLDGIYIFGHPAQPTSGRLWGLPVAQFDGDAAGIAYTGDFLNFIQLFERRGLEVAVGFVGDQFREGKKTIRAGIRLALAIYRPSAFVKTTF